MNKSAGRKGINWKDYEFFDLQTERGGYSRHEAHETTALDRLVLDENDSLKVTGWEPIYDTHLGIGLSADDFQTELLKLTSGKTD